MALAGKVFAVTGGASGIGFATAQILSQRGATVCIADVDPDAMERAESYFQPLNVPFSITKVDISRRDEVESWINGIVEQFGKLDGAANVAGVIGKHHGLREVKDLDDDEWNRIIAVNLTGTMLVKPPFWREYKLGNSQQVLPKGRASKNLRRRFDCQCFFDPRTERY